MGILKRAVPRSVKKAVHPARTAKRAVKRAVVPKPVRELEHVAFDVAHPLRAASESVEDVLFGAGKGGQKHGGSSTRRSRNVPAPKSHFYVVTAPECARGIYRTWPECEAAVKGQRGAAFRKVGSLEEANALLGGPS
jgi:hypothetical protein